MRAALTAEPSAPQFGQQCPSREEWSEVLKGKYVSDLVQTKDLLTHLGICNECMSVVQDIPRARGTKRLLWQVALAITCVLLSWGIWKWRSHALPVVSTSIDLTRLEPTRGEDGVIIMPIISLPRANTELHIALPVGSTDTSYQVAIFDSGSARRRLDTAVGSSYTNAPPTISAKLDLGSLPSGRYVLGLCGTGSTCDFYPVELH